MKVGFGSLEAMVERKLADTEYLQFVIMNAFAPPLPFAFKQTEVQDLPDPGIDDGES